MGNTQTTNIEQNVMMAKTIAENFLADIVSEGQHPLEASMIASIVLAHTLNLLWLHAKDDEQRQQVSDALKFAVITVIDTAKMNGIVTDLVAPTTDGARRTTTLITNDGEIVRAN